MKKKIEHLLAEGKLSGNAEFKKLHKAHESAKVVAAQAKTVKSTAKGTYRTLLEGQHKGQSEQLVELLGDFRKAKYMQQYHRVEADLAKHRLYQWVEGWLQKSEVPHEPKAKAGKSKVVTAPKVKKATVKKSKPASAKPEMSPAQLTDAAKATASKKRKPTKGQN